MGLVQGEEEKMYVPVTGGRILITGENCPRQVAHNDFQVLGKKDLHSFPRYFMIVLSLIHI